jgi:hypothetical protein
MTRRLLEKGNRSVAITWSGVPEHASSPDTQPCDESRDDEHRDGYRSGRQSSADGSQDGPEHDSLEPASSFVEPYGKEAACEQSEFRTTRRQWVLQ